MYVKEKKLKHFGEKSSFMGKKLRKAEKTQGKAEKLIVWQSTFLVYAENLPKKNPCHKWIIIQGDGIQDLTS